MKTYQLLCFPFFLLSTVSFAWQNEFNISEKLPCAEGIWNTGKFSDIVARTAFSYRDRENLCPEATAEVSYSPVGKLRIDIHCKSDQSKSIAFSFQGDVDEMYGYDTGTFLETIKTEVTEDYWRVDEEWHRPGENQGDGGTELLVLSCKSKNLTLLNRYRGVYGDTREVKAEFSR